MAKKPKKKFEKPKTIGVDKKLDENIKKVLLFGVKDEKK